MSESEKLKELEEFLKNYEYDSTKNKISLSLLKEAEEKIGIKFGSQLTKYLTEYGYLGYKSIEFYGINSIQAFNSDLIKQTRYLHDYFAITKSYIAFEKSSESCYILIDSDDNIYNCNLESKQIKKLNIKLFDYIIKKFKEENKKI